MQTLQSQNVTPCRITKQERIDQLIDHLFNGHLSFAKAAAKVGVTRRQAYRYFNEWKQSHEAQQIDSEWWSLYLRLRDENPEKALECLTRLKYRMITEKHEIKATVKEIKLEWQLESNTTNPVQTTPEAT